MGIEDTQPWTSKHPWHLSQLRRPAPCNAHTTRHNMFSACEDAAFMDCEISVEEIVSSWIGDDSAVQQFLQHTAPDSEEEEEEEAAVTLEIQSVHSPRSDAYQSPHSPQSPTSDGGTSSADTASHDPLPSLKEDPLMRRKMRNRRSAAASRIRKKAHEKEVQQQLVHLAYQNEQMCIRLSALQRQNAQLQAEVLRLKGPQTQSEPPESPPMQPSPPQQPSQ